MTSALILSEHDLTDWTTRFRSGDVPSPLPYGVDALRTRGWNLTGAGRSSGAVASKLRDVVEHRSGLVVDRALHAFGEARRSDVVLALLEREGMVPALLKRAHVPPWSSRPLVIWSCWLADDVRSAGSEARARIRKRVEAADLITHMSRHETEILVDLGIPEERLFAVTYGVSHEYYVPDAEVEQDLELLAVGQDRGRDYGTLFAAVRGTDLRLDVVCKPDNLRGLDVPDNVTVHDPVPLPEYRRLLLRARTVAVPTRDLAYPTGSSVALEAASSGCCVVATGTRAMSDYFVAGSNARLVAEGDADGWRTTLEELREDPAQRARLGAAARCNVTERFNADHMWTELADVMSDRGIVRDIREGHR